ncbi:MAG: hypothetical protein MJZ92_03700 [Paludibacteraceae bacterium]|nr:hypothetical protein [Paludibacteraceae bacterium]
MKKFCNIAVILAFLPLAASAQKTGTTHNCVIWLDGGATSLIGTMPQASPAWGGGGSLGLGYELQAHSFLFQTGLGARYTQDGLRINDGRFVLPDQYDSQGFKFNYIYEQSRRNDTYRNIEMDLPLLVGAQFNHFYFLAGAKIQFALYKNSSSKGYYSTLGEYIELIDPFEDMPNHKFFVDKPRSSSSVDHKASFNVAASAEIGGEFALSHTANKHESYMRIAAFIDFSLLDCHTRTHDPLLQLPSSFDPYAEGEKMIDDIFLTDYLHSDVGTSPIRSMMVGAKITFLISGKAKSACVICNGNYPTNQKNNLRRGTRILADW